MFRKEYGKLPDEVWFNLLMGVANKYQETKKNEEKSNQDGMVSEIKTSSMG